MSTMPAAERPRSILIVDDDEDIRSIAATILRLRGYDVATAANGKEALEIVRSGRVLSLILLDLRMPVMSGEEFKRALDDECAPIPVVILSGDGSLEARTATMGAAGVMRKPIELSDLIATVQRYV